MFHLPDYLHNVSLRLSEVMDDIGVNERTVMKGRRAWLLREALITNFFQLKDMNISSHHLGSQVEATTTPGLESDSDCLYCHNDINVIQDWSEWEPGKINYLMIQDEIVSPGYCLLQRLRDDATLPLDSIPNERHFRDSSGHIVLRNTALNPGVKYGYTRHGPANAIQGIPGHYDSDMVFALPCKTWPVQARHWLDQQGVGIWPSYEIRRYCSTTQCFVVGVGSKGSVNEELEWRISTSLAERCLVFYLNITQIRCYVLMKMILKTYIKPQFGEAVSSFICKTILFHCIANTHINAWKENKLLFHLQLCLFALYICILYENCPHFILHENNLMAGRVSLKTKHHLLDFIHTLINSKGRVLLGVESDLLGVRLQCNLLGWYDLVNNAVHSFEICKVNSGALLYNTALYVCEFNKVLIATVLHCSYEKALRTLLKFTLRLTRTFRESKGYFKAACRLSAPFLCTSLGSVLASFNIHQNNSISSEALNWISLGLNSDVSSSKLKLAFMLYCIGDIQSIAIILRDIEEKYDPSVVEPICKCYIFFNRQRREAFRETALGHDEEAIQYITAFCVRFLPCEINCVPKELRYEMFRYTEENLAVRGIQDFWMDWAVVDSLPYLYFLQYKTYGYLMRHDEKQAALSNLAWTIENEPNLGHRETAINLLGQCMEQEGRAIDSLRCYLLSLNLRERNNAAKVHICRLLCTMINAS